MVVSFLWSALLLHLAGVIYLLLISPLFMFLSFARALLYDSRRNIFQRPRNKNLLAAGFVLPYLLAPLESRLAPPSSFRRAENVVDIAAPAAVAWRPTVRVAPIGAAEPGLSLS